MRRTDDNEWMQLLIDGGASPPPISDNRFRTWMSGRRIFVSSTQDEEMMPARQAVRQYLADHGADAVMWESITPSDSRPQDAYLEGVSRSELFILLAGRRYGVSDSSGFSPIHKEANRAADLRLTRLLFERSDVSLDQRDGKLNDWILSLYSELSAAKYLSTEDLVAVVDSRLREIAATQETYWVKLGQLVFPGSVKRFASGNKTTFEVSAELRDSALRRAVSALTGSAMQYSSATRLTWALETHPVTVSEVTSNSIGLSTEEVRITCSGTDEQGGRSFAFYGGVTHIDQSGRRFGPSDQAEVWASEALFGRVESERNENAYFRAGSGEPGPPLSDVLAANGAVGWRAEGLARLYVVEEFNRLFGGFVSAMEVGPATATGVRLVARLAIPQNQQIETRGFVLYRRSP